MTLKTVLKFVILLVVLYAGYQFLAQGKASGKAYSMNAAEDISKAVSEARASHKRVLIDVGSKGCIWCVRLHRFIEADPELREGCVAGNTVFFPGGCLTRSFPPGLQAVPTNLA